MFSMNGRNCHMIQKIGIELEKIENCSINKAQQIEKSCVLLYVIAKKIANKQKKKNKKVDISFKLKCRG